MNRARLVRVQVSLLVVVVLLVLWRLAAGPPAPDGLVVFTDLDAGHFRHAAFEVKQPTEFAIEAVGSAEDAGLAAYGWILRRDDRSVAWHQEGAPAERMRGTLVRTRDTLLLDPGIYDAYFAGYGGEFDASLRRTRWYDDADGWRLVVRPTADDAPVAALSGTEAARPGAWPGAVWASGPMRNAQHATYLFELDAPTTAHLYALGELGGEPHDVSWIEDATTGERVWSFAEAATEPAGGLPRNRRFTGTVELTPGTYRAVAETDRRHAYGSWRGNPPFDPYGWGIAMTFDDPSVVRPFDPWTAREPLVSFTRVPDDTERMQRFEVRRPLHVVVYSLGEVTGPGDEYDYAELLREAPQRRETVWQMSWEGSSHAGGAEKNRVEVAFLRLDPGVYTFRYQTDGSHAFGDWNSRAPDYEERWGAALFPVEPTLDEEAFRLLLDPTAATRAAAPQPPAPPPTPEVAGTEIVRWEQQGRNQQRKMLFRLEAPARLAISALGEIARYESYDYGWIEDAASGERVWAMTWDNTEPAGGNARNRAFEGVVELPAGRYVAYFVTDNSHFYGDFGSDGPDRPERWGMTIRRLP